MLSAGDSTPEQKLQMISSGCAKTQPCVSIAAFLYGTPQVKFNKGQHLPFSC